PSLRHLSTECSAHESLHCVCCLERREGICLSRTATAHTRVSRSSRPDARRTVRRTVLSAGRGVNPRTPAGCDSLGHVFRGCRCAPPTAKLLAAHAGCASHAEGVLGYPPGMSERSEPSWLLKLLTTIGLRFATPKVCWDIRQG